MNINDKGFIFDEFDQIGDKWIYPSNYHVNGIMRDLCSEKCEEIYYNTMF